MLIYTIEGNPVPWQAPLRCGNRYFSPHYKKQQEAIWQLKSQVNLEEPISAPVILGAIFYMPIPASASKRLREQMLKFAEDCLERAGILSNDSIIFDGPAKKVYGVKPRTVLTIEVVSNNGQKYGEAL
jgi:Holliday junction resolvase RusA-like endonuclease